MSTSKWTCRFPGCDHEYETDDYFGEAIPLINEHNEVVGWMHNGDDHMTPISPDFLAHMLSAHPRDIEGAKARLAKTMTDASAVHREWFPESDVS